MNLLEMAAANKFTKTNQVKKLTVSDQIPNTWDVYQIPLEFLYYNDKNGRINTVYKQYQVENEPLQPEPGDSQYNEIFEKFIYNSNPKALNDTLQSIRDKSQQEPGVVLPDGRVIDGNRRFTALRRLENQDNMSQTFEAIILPLNANDEKDEKKIKELELDLQLGLEERVNYDPIDRIFDVYNTIEVEKLMTIEEYKKASGAGNTKGINKDIRLANLILRFIEIVSPGDNPVDKFYLARELKLDGPIEEIEATINKLKDADKESITDAVLTVLAVEKSTEGSADPTRKMREIKKNILKNEDAKQHFLDAVDSKTDSKVDDIIEAFEKKPIKNSNDLKQMVASSSDLENTVTGLQKSVERLIFKGEKDSKRKEALTDLQDIRDDLLELNTDDFKELTQDELFEAKEALREINDILFKLKQGI